MADDQERDAERFDSSSFEGPSIEYIVQARIEPPVITIRPESPVITIGPDVSTPPQANGG